MRFCVSVPVLSEQMTEAEPRVSTAGRRLMMAFFLTMRVTPMDSTIVTTAGSPSGMAETASETAVMNRSIRASSPCVASPMMKTIAHAASATMPRYLPSCASFCCSGVLTSFSPAKRPAILPISVFMPVPVTTALAVP